MMKTKSKRYLIDTNIYTNYLKDNQHHQLNKFIDSLNAQEVIVSSFVLLELLTFYRNSPENIKKPLMGLIAKIMKAEIVDFNHNGLSVCLDVRRELLSLGRTNRSLDPLLATLAITHDCILVTANKKDFIGIPNLKTKIYSQQFQRWE